MSAKEIVKRLKDSLDYEFDLSFNDRKELLSYIEQLQTTAKDCKQKLEQYENPDDLTLFYMWLDTKAKDKMKQMENEIINLKQQNQIITELGEQLENNRDKAIEYIKIELSQGGERELRDLVDGYEVLKLLKGDSDD